jgi:hypothetical protein
VVGYGRVFQALLEVRPLPLETARWFWRTAFLIAKAGGCVGLAFIVFGCIPLLVGLELARCRPPQRRLSPWVPLSARAAQPNT